ncbi:MAG: hypothetical protein ACO280_11395 [Pseudohongiellaceae bacterium]|jgi:hypothetical protein
MLIDLIVGSAVLLAVGYCGCWICSPALRARIERPKYTFLEQVRRQQPDPPEDNATHRRFSP